MQQLRREYDFPASMKMISETWAVSLRMKIFILKGAHLRQ